MTKTKEELFNKFLLETKNKQAFENFEAKEKYIGKKFYILETSKQRCSAVTITKAVYEKLSNSIKISFKRDHITYKYDVKDINNKNIFSTETNALRHGIEVLETQNKRYKGYWNDNDAQIKAITSYLSNKRGNNV